MDDRDKALDALRKNGIEIQSQKEEIEEASVRGALRRTAGLGRRLFDPSDLLRYPKGEVESRGGQFRPKGSSRGAVRRALPEARGARVRKLLDAAAKKRKRADQALSRGKPDEAMALRAEARALEAAVPVPEMASPDGDVLDGGSVLAVIDGLAYMKGNFSDGSNAIVARSRDGKAVGYLSYQTETETVIPGVEDRKIVLFDVKVAPDYRRRGIATRLVEQAQAANPMALTQTNARTPDGEALFSSMPGIEIAPEYVEDMATAGPPAPFPDWVVENDLDSLSMNPGWVATDVRRSGLDDSWTPEVPEGGYASGWELGEDGEWAESGKMMMASPAERRMEVRVSKQVGRVTNADGAEIEIDLDYAPADGAAPGTLEYREAYANHITLVRAALNKWGEQGTYLAEENDSVGFHERIRAILEGRESARSPEEKALAWEMLFNARRSIRPLYRGQRIHDSNIGLGIFPDDPPDDIRSWTTDPSTAKEFADGLGFASDLFDEGDDGSDWQYDVVDIEPGEALGIPVNAYFGRWGDLGVPPENFMFGKDGEWILWPPGTTPETDTADSPLRVGRVRAAMASPDWPEGVTVGPQTPRSRDNGQRVAAVKRVMSELVTRWPEAAELDIRVYYADDDESTPFADYIERVKSDPAIRPGASPPPSQGRIVVPYSGREIREVVPIEALTPSLMAYDGSSFGLPPAFYNRIQSLTGEEPSPPTFVFDVGVGRGRVQYDPTETSISNRWRRSWPEYHELVARHEVGHLVADTILFRRYGPDLRPDDSEPAAQDDGRAWYRRREDRLRQLLVEYGITPEEIASVTPYATASPHEAFAEMYAAAFSPRVFALTAELREKFLNLIRSELPEHSVELPEGAGVALGRFAREMASPDDLDIMVERRQPYEYPGPEVHDQNLRGELIDWLVFQAESAAKYPNSAMRWEINNGDPGPGPFFRGQPPISRAPLADAGPRSWSKDPSVAVYHAPRVLVKRDGTISPVLFDSQVAGRDQMLAVEILMTDPTPKSGLDLTRHQTGYEWESEVILDAANWPKGAYATPIRVIVGGPGEVVSDEVVYERVDQVLREQHGYTGPKLTDPFAAAQAEMASPADRITATQVDEALAEMASPTSEVTPGEAALSLTARAFPLIRTSPKSATKLDPDVGKGIDEGLTTVSLFWYGFEEEGIPVLVSDDAESKVFPESSLYLGPDGLMKRPVSPSAPLDSVSAKDYASGLGGGPDTLASASRHLYPEEVRQEVILVDPGRKGAAYRVVGPGTETPEFVHNQAITRSGVASMTIIHEIGHIVGHRMIENLTGSITGSAEEDEQGYRAIFDRYGITPEEIASVSRYGTTSLVEAFAELYGAYYGGLIDDLDPDLRDKFEQAITDLMPDHDIRDKTYDTPSVGLAARLYEKMLFVTDARWSDPAGRAEMEGALAERLSPLSTDQRAEVRRRYAAGDMASPEIPPSLDYEYEVDGRRIRAVVRFADVDASVRRIGKQGTTTRVIGAYRAEPRLFPTPSGSQLEWVPVGAVTIDRDTGDLALIGVDASMRGQGFASELLRVAREYTGLPLDKADPMVSESGRRLAAREGIYVEEDTDFGPQVTPDEAAESWWNRVASAMAHPAREVEWLDGLETEDEFIAAVKRRTEMASPGSEPTVSTEATSNLLRERPEFAASLAVAIEEARGRWPGLVNVPVVVGDDAAPIFPNASGITVKSSIPRGDGGRMLAGIRMVPELPPGGFTPSVEGEAIETAPTSEVSAAWLWSNDADRFTSLAVSLNSTDAIIVNPSVREWDWAIEEIVGPLYIEPPADGLPPLELVTGDDLLASVITHEYGHIVGRAVIRRFENEIEALSERSWSELSELPEGWSDPYKRMFDEYGITPEEIADVSEYATTSPSEAFAEMYASRFIDHGQFGRAMDPVLREKFDRLLATELPDHALPEPRGGAEIEMASPDGSALPATAALGIRTSRVTPLAEKFPEQVRGIDEEVRAFAERWPEGVERLDYLYLSDDSGGHPLREGTSGSFSVTTVGTRSGVLSTERGIKIEPSRIGTPAGATVGGTLLAKLTGEELTRDTKLSNGNVVASWGFWHSYSDFDLSAFDFPVTPEQLDQAHRLITIHELGHVVGEAIIPFRDDFRDADYQVLLQKYGITPEEIAAVSEYATTAAIEAFAEIYAMRFSEMADQMDPFLREKFDALLRAELPGHRVPDAQMTLPLEMASPESALPVVMALDSSLDTSPVTPLAERFPEQVTIIEEEFQELDSRWPGWKFYLDHLRFSDDKAPITTTWGEQDTTTLTKETTEGAYQIWWHQGGEDEGLAIQKHRGMTLRPSRRGSTSHGTPGILLERLTGTDLSRTLVNYGGEEPGLSSSYDQWRRAGRDDLTQTGLATAEQLDRAFRVVVAHEIGHLVGEAILPYGEAFDPGQSVAAYQRLFEKYEITPQEIAGVSEYATLHPMEAFAEIYAMMFSELVDDMDPALREKFDNLMRGELPEHKLPETAMASPDESALPVVAALGISTSPVTPLAEQFPEQVRGIEEEVLALVERWPDATEYLDYVYLADDDRGHPHHAVGGSYGVGRARDGTVRSRGIKIKPSRLGFPSSFITGGILLEQLTGEELTERTMVANASWQTWRRMVGDEAADLSETEFPVSAEQIDRASRLIIIHELGHAVGEAVIPLTQGGGGRAREKKYEALLRKYGITPEEIASVSEYATTSPAEAFAEIYSMMFSEMADGMDPDLREKFSRLLRERLPEHQIPDFSREPAILTA